MLNLNHTTFLPICFVISHTSSNKKWPTCDKFLLTGNIFSILHSPQYFYFSILLFIMCFVFVMQFLLDRWTFRIQVFFVVFTLNKNVWEESQFQLSMRCQIVWYCLLWCELPSLNQCRSLSVNTTVNTVTEYRHWVAVMYSLELGWTEGSHCQGSSFCCCCCY